MTTSADLEYRSRDHLFTLIHDGIRHALLSYAGFNLGGSHRDSEA